MGSYTSRTRTNIVPKPLQVLPATESWSTLDAFQATVKKDEHLELINRSKTQKSLIKTNSFSTKRRTKTLNVIPANSSPSSVHQPRIKNIPITAATLSPERSVGQEEVERPSQISERSLNARRPTHFYEVRQAMVNRTSLKKLESIASISTSRFDDQNIKKSLPNLSDRVNSETNSPNKQVVVSSKFNSSPHLKEKVNSETNLASKPVVLPSPTSSINKSPNKSEVVSQPTVPNLSQTKLDKKTAVATLSAVQLETKAEAAQSAIIALHNTFKVDPAPHATFAPISLPSQLELKCQATAAGLTLLSSEESKRKELEGILQQWEKSGKLISIEAYALSVPRSQTTTVTELASSLVNTNAGYIKYTEGNEFHVQVAQAYSIYVWIANNIMYDIEQWQVYQSGDESNSLVSSVEAEEVLDTRVTICTGYANLFKALALAAGIEAETVNGHVKQWKCLSEEKPDADITFKPSRGNAHTWNTVSNYYT
jgi:hypothetical protein